MLTALPPDLVDRFHKVGWQLVRTYTEEIGVSWAEAFGTGDRGALEQYWPANGIRFEWLPGDGLRTWQRCPALLKRPVTGRWAWFNQIAFLSEFTMDPDVRDFLVEEYGPEGGLPFTTRFGDGAPVDRRGHREPHGAEMKDFSVISGAQVQDTLRGREKQVAELVEATYRLHEAGKTINPPSPAHRCNAGQAARLRVNLDPATTTPSAPD